MRVQSRAIYAFASLVIASLGTAGCSTLRIDVDHDTAVDFGGYSTYAWEPGEASVPARNPPTDDLQLRRVRAALENALGARGLERVTGDADVWVRYGIAYGERYGSFPRNRLGVGYLGEYGGYSSRVGYRRYWRGFGPVWGGLYEEAPLVRPIWRIRVDLIDARAKQIVWSGWAEDWISSGATPDARIRKIRRAITALLRRYPPTR